MRDYSIVFIHGNSLSGESYKNQLNYFKDINSFIFELPGHGENQKASFTEDDFSIEGLVKHLKNFVEENFINNFILVGHSLGGHVALEAMEELPGVKGLLIFGTPPITKPANIGEAFLTNEAMPLLFQEILSEQDLDALSKVYTANKKELINIRGQINATNPLFRPCFGKGVGELKHKDEKGIVETSNIPIAVFQGELEPFVNLDYLQSIKWKNLWSNKVHIIENAGHSIQLDNPERFNNLLKEYILSLSSL